MSHTDLEIDNTYPIDLSKAYSWHYDGPVGGHVDIGNGFVLAFSKEEPEDVEANDEEPEHRMHVALFHNGKEIASDYQAADLDQSFDEEAMFRDAVVEVLSTSWGEMQDLAGISKN